MPLFVGASESYDTDAWEAYNFKKENAKLRHDLEEANNQAEEVCIENAKLRELVADMWFWHYEGHIDSESQEHQMLHIDGVLNRMHELGVEVGK